MRKLHLVTAPATEPVTLADAKAFLRIDGTDEDALITSLIVVARQHAESFLGRALISQTWRMFLDSWPVGKTPWWHGTREMPRSELTGEKKDVELPLPPLQSVTHIKTYNDNDEATTFDSANYYVGAYSGDKAQKGRIALKDSASWPIYDRNIDGIEIQFVAGYGNAATDVPYQIRQAITQEVAYLYEHRAECGKDCMGSSLAKSLLKPFKVMKL